MQKEPQIREVLESADFVEIQAANRAEAERVFGAIFDELETEAQCDGR
ncbi:MAG: hypothetical protein M0T84_08570 [Betaproteobacteria bacterium]|nr:hypothetical protein [Betaproteobacteria bacterium]